MGYFRLSVIVAVVVFGACVIHQAGATDFEWKKIPAIQRYLDTHPAAKRMAESPLDDLIDLLIALLIYIINIILGEPLTAKITSLESRLNALGG